MAQVKSPEILHVVGFENKIDDGMIENIVKELKVDKELGLAN